MRPTAACLSVTLAACLAAAPCGALAASVDATPAPRIDRERVIGGDPQPLPPAEARALFERALESLDGTHTWRLSARAFGAGETRILRRDASGGLAVETRGEDGVSLTVHVDGRAWSMSEGGEWRPDPDAAAGRDALARHALADAPALRALALQADPSLQVRDLGPAVRRLDGCAQRLLAVGDPGPRPARGRLELTSCVDSGEPSVAEWIAPATSAGARDVAAYYFHVDIAPIRAPGDAGATASDADHQRHPEAIAALERSLEVLRATPRIEAAALVPVLPGSEPQPVRVRYQRRGPIQIDMAVLGLPTRVHIEGDALWLRIDREAWIPLDAERAASLELDDMFISLWLDPDGAWRLIDGASDARLEPGDGADTLRVVLAGFPQPAVAPGVPPDAPERVVVVIDASSGALLEVIETYGGEGLPAAEYRVEHRPATFAALVRD